MNPDGIVIWLTGLSSAGKTTIAHAVLAALREQGRRVEWLDGDEVRRHLCRDLGFSKADRDENVRRLGYVASLLARHEVIVLVSAIAPYRHARDLVREDAGRFIEVYVNAPLAVCEARDVKGLYRRARQGEVEHLTGVDDPYEPPLAPEVECRTDRETIEESAGRVLAAIAGRRVLRCPQCDRTFSCEPEGDCWCKRLPPLRAVPQDSAAVCLCPCQLTPDHRDQRHSSHSLPGRQGARR